MYTAQEVMEYVQAEDVKFLRLAFCDVFGEQKNISIMPEELQRAFEDGISFDASAIAGFGSEEKSDLLLFPDASTLCVLPWRPAQGRVVRLFCDIRRPDGTTFELDGRRILKQAADTVRDAGYACDFGAEFEFYLFRTDEMGEPTDVPFDRAGYMDIAPLDRGENVRREICLTLSEMGIHPESSHHEEGPGQHEIDFRYSDPLSAADNAVTFRSVVRTLAARNGLYASFDPKPLADHSGNGMHVNISLHDRSGAAHTRDAFMAGILAHVRELTVFFNRTAESYRRLGEQKAPKYITWSPENRSQLIRIPAAKGEYRRIELRSPDALANSYLTYALLIHAGLDGIRRGLCPPPPTNLNLYRAERSITDQLSMLPETLEEARLAASQSEWLAGLLPSELLRAYGVGQ